MFGFWVGKENKVERKVGSGIGDAKKRRADGEDYQGFICTRFANRGALRWLTFRV